MYLILKQYFNKRKLMISAWVFNTFFILLFFALVLEGNTLYWYTVLISFFILFLLLVVDFMQFKSFKKSLKNACENALYKTDSNIDFNNQTLSSINDVHSRYINQLAEIKELNKVKNIFFSKWVHEMKTPITVINLIIERLKDKQSISSEVTEINIENNKLLKYVDDSLNFIRLEEFEADYKPQKVELVKLVKESINDNKKAFIYNKMYPQIVESQKNLTVLTDYKWSKFIINQIIDNAIKYSKKADSSSDSILLELTIENTKTALKIKDYGVGIAKHDLKRVFNPFFTGDIGKQQQKATGMGLYLCKNIAEKLNHNISIESQKNKGTIVTIAF